MKTIEDLQKSREARETIVQEFGEVPQSIMKHDRNARAIDLMVTERAYKDRTGDFQAQHGKLAKAFGSSHSGTNNMNCRAGEDAALSRFPQNVGRSLLLLYTQKGDTVCDPFAGHNSRMEMCWRANRNYIGNDISKEFMEANRKIAGMLAEEASADMFGACHYTAWIKLNEGDSRHLKVENEAGDFTITSPPYWDIEYYGDEPEQLGKGKTYEEFLTGLGDVAKENFRVLKSGAFCVWCVNDFRKNGKFYSYHEDTADLLRAAGFEQHDIAITDLGQPIRAAFAQQVIESKILPKRHEYCLIYQKAKSPNEKTEPRGGEEPHGLLTQGSK